MSLYDAVAAEIDALGVSAHGTVGAALAGAEAFDRKPSALMLKVVLEALTELRSLAPPAEHHDALDELLARRNARIASG